MVQDKPKRVLNKLLPSPPIVIELWNKMFDSLHYFFIYIIEYFMFMYCMLIGQNKNWSILNQTAVDWIGIKFRTKLMNVK